MKNTRSEALSDFIPMIDVIKTEQPMQQLFDKPWICPGCERKYELEHDIDDCPCWNKK